MPGGGWSGDKSHRQRPRGGTHRRAGRQKRLKVPAETGLESQGTRPAEPTVVLEPILAGVDVRHVVPEAVEVQAFGRREQAPVEIGRRRFQVEVRLASPKPPLRSRPGKNHTSSLIVAAPVAANSVSWSSPASRSSATRSAGGSSREAQAADPPNATRQADDFKVEETEEGIQFSMYVTVSDFVAPGWQSRRLTAGRSFTCFEEKPPD